MDEAGQKRSRSNRHGVTPAPGAAGKHLWSPKAPACPMPACPMPACPMPACPMPASPYASVPDASVPDASRPVASDATVPSDSQTRMSCLRHPTGKMLLVYTDQQAVDLEAAGWELQNDWRFVPPAAPLPEASEEADQPFTPPPNQVHADQTGQTGQQQPPAPDQVTVPPLSAMPKSLKVALDEPGRAALKTKAFRSFTTADDQTVYSPMSRWTTELMKAAWGSRYHSTRQNVLEALQIAVWINMNPNLTAGDSWTEVRDGARKHATSQTGGRFCWFKAAEAERMQMDAEKD